MSHARSAALALLVSVQVGCGVPVKQTHSLAALPPAGQARIRESCDFWLASVDDRRSPAQRESWHGAQRVELDAVAEGVRAILRSAQLPESGQPGRQVSIEVLNAYLDTVAGMRSFNLVMRVEHANGGAWIARGRSVNVPWTNSQASVRQSLADALADARTQLVEGLMLRCADPGQR